ncbi:hypothetical protein [Vulcanisaeta thermophila]|uniref:hypothetical protein n=1 Tax=Vulcanisaeta thermophila TaxID=867917 RepID=UPI001EE36A69|nr:hypothetical protein [Vulcanisaeta thermophila]
MFVRELAVKVLRLLGNDRVEVVDYCNCLNYTYVQVRAGGRDYLGIAYTPIEDLRSGEMGEKTKC